MIQKRALVVDDSRSARAFLGRILEQHGLAVDNSGTAEEALEYLTRHRPDVIFMDHLMPGMDGLQAVRLIKNDPRTATIPILMYTSQEGELYLSQARALGALGVLPKQTQPGDVSKALHQLRLINDRRQEATAASAPIIVPPLAPPVAPSAPLPPLQLHLPPMPQPATVTDITPAVDLTQPNRVLDRRAAPPEPLSTAHLGQLPPEVSTALDAMLREHSIELRRYVGEHLTQHADRIVGDVRLLLRDAEPDAGASSRSAAFGGRLAGWLIAAALLAAGAAGALWYQSLTEQRALDRRLREAQTQLATTREQLDQLANAANTPASPPTVVDGVPVPADAAGGAAVGGSAPGGSAQVGESAGALPGGGTAAVSAGAASGTAHTAPASAAAAAAMGLQIMRVPFGETPLAGTRIAWVRGLLDRWQSQGQRGTVQIRGYFGRYCLGSGAGETAQLAAPDSLHAKCAQLATPALSSPAAQSVEFANMLTAFRASSGNAIDVQVQPGNGDPRVAYPEATDALTAGEWNRVAAENNRVELRWQPRP